MRLSSNVLHYPETMLNSNTINTKGTYAMDIFHHQFVQGGLINYPVKTRMGWCVHLDLPRSLGGF